MQVFLDADGERQLTSSILRQYASGPHPYDEKKSRQSFSVGATEELKDCLPGGLTTSPPKYKPQTSSRALDIR